MADIYPWTDIGHMSDICPVPMPALCPPNISRGIYCLFHQVDYPMKIKLQGLKKQGQKKQP